MSSRPIQSLEEPRDSKEKTIQEPLVAAPVSLQISSARVWSDRLIRGSLFLAASVSVLVTLGILGILVFESIEFFKNVSLWTFLTDSQWTPLFADPRFGIRALFAGSFTTTLVALSVAIPVGTIIAIYLSEYASARWRETLKPILELLSGVPTVVFGYFALLVVTPFLQMIIPGLPGFNMLGAGLVMGIMIIPYVSSLSEDAMRSVPMSLREGAFALGCTRLQVSLGVVYPAAFSGITAAYVLAVSRAFGETMVVAIAAGMQPQWTFDPTEPAQTITAFIVQVSLGDLPHGSIGYQTIFAAGLTLLLMTLAFNILGHSLKTKFREKY